MSKTKVERLVWNQRNQCTCTMLGNIKRIPHLHCFRCYVSLPFGTIGYFTHNGKRRYCKDCAVIIKLI